MLATRKAAAPERQQTGELQAFKAQFFRALGHPIRIKILEILIRRGHTVQELQDVLRLDQPIVSQQLAVLRNRNIVSAQKEGLSVTYTLRDPQIAELLLVARQIFNNHLVSTRGLLRELQRETRQGSAR
jgi:ArsR family transcriptional regulator